MEHGMKISPSTVRRLRTERGWSQDQLAMASGLSLRTIQRVEAEGVVSMSSTVCLAATTCEGRLMDLQEEQGISRVRIPWGEYDALLLGLVIMTVVVMSEGLRSYARPLAPLFMSIHVMSFGAGAAMMLPAIVRLLGKRQFISAALVVMGTPLITLLVAGAIYGLAGGRYPAWQLTFLGGAGVVLVAMAFRDLRRVALTAARR